MNLLALVGRTEITSGVFINTHVTLLNTSLHKENRIRQQAIVWALCVVNSIIWYNSATFDPLNKLFPRTIVHTFQASPTIFSHSIFHIDQMMNNQGDCVSSSALSPITSGSTFLSESVGTTANGSDSDSTYLWPTYFVKRPDGTLTALVEVDQLPDFIRIRGLTQKLSAVDTADMTCVGIKKKNQKKYSVDIADIPGKFCFSELSKHASHKNASAAAITAPSSKASVSQSS